MNVRKPSNEHIDAKRFPVLESFFADPKRTALLLQRAVDEGAIKPDALESALQPLVEQARTGIERAEQEKQDQYELQSDILKTHLATKLVNFTGGMENLKEILIPFCKANQLSLKPRKGDAFIDDMLTTRKPDWESRDGKYAINVTHDSITILAKLRGRWMPFYQ